jgi:RNA polymerase sigma factor (sigma-70 family)
VLVLKDLQHIVKKCQRNEALAQRDLYESYKSILYGICRRYIKNEEDAKDVMVEVFVKIFNHIQDFTFEGSFEGWMKRIAVNESLMYLRKKVIYYEELDNHQMNVMEDVHYEDEYIEQDIMKLMDQLPDGYRTVLNMYAIEGYKHKEIAEILGVSINTSKSQLILARKRIQELMKKNQISLI